MRKTLISAAVIPFWLLGASLGVAATSSADAGTGKAAAGEEAHDEEEHSKSCGSLGGGSGQVGAPNLYGGTSDEAINGLNPDFQKNLSAMISAAKADLGGTLSIFSGHRSVEKQAKLFKAAVQKYGSEAAARKWVAPPGKSNHNHGNAVDMRYNGVRIARPSEIDSWMGSKLANFGLTRPMSYEPWHVEPSGARAVDTGGCSDFEAPPMVLMPWEAERLSTSIVPGSL